MTDKVLCPWCGAEMKEHLTCASGGHPAWLNYKCKNIWCSAVSPYGDTREEAKAKALHRYTPPLKPMTLEEVREKDDEELWVESRERGSGHMQGYCELSIFSSFNGYERFDFYPCGSDIAYDYKPRDYNRDWRCWERKPTNEERSAAEWETSKQE